MKPFIIVTVMNSDRTETVRMIASKHVLGGMMSPMGFTLLSIDGDAAIGSTFGCVITISETLQDVMRQIHGEVI